MSAHTTFGIGGPADVFLDVETPQALVEIIELLKRHGIGWFLMGDGANLLVSDKGIRGVVLHLGGQFESVTCDSESVTAGAAARISRVADIVAQNGMTGFEGVGTVPGSVGGAIVMNAGTHRGYIGDVVAKLNAIEPGGQLVTLTKDQCGFKYRGSRFQMEPGFIITEVTLKLEKGDPVEIAAELDNIRKHRRDTQPQGKSAGCIFKNPAGGSAGKLIEASGLKGMRVGGAIIASEHANFIINDNSASASDVFDLAKHVQKTVRNNHGVELEFEVRVVGDW
jgi:UDP-N-acetylmuramate dehydrogenase